MPAAPSRTCGSGGGLPACLDRTGDPEVLAATLHVGELINRP
ncbi:hypothetical protein [Sphaerisporangium rubeum]|uniref:Uncharacterized protein n=1 Tax=Sphaerisporangium rubeum TaxID=321317 RepID=A0A7X0M6N5_9ACTN|nr:hypothetical protein [Sphaerisporangium rubeum]MBB6472041.1 hypothetical protein [Sphaerisporangium rubeum]